MAVLQASLQNALSIAVVDRAPDRGSWLSDAELAAHDSLRTDIRRAEFRASRAAVHIATRELKGPFAVRRRRPVFVSLAHTNGRAAAVASVTPVGIDLEQAGAAAPEHAHYFLNKRERQLLDLYDATTLWTLKEAAWKALRLQTREHLTALELQHYGGEAWQLAHAGQTRVARAVLQEIDGYRLAVMQLEPWNLG